MQIVLFSNARESFLLSHLCPFNNLTVLHFDDAVGISLPLISMLEKVGEDTRPW